MKHSTEIWLPWAVIVVYFLLVLVVVLCSQAQAFVQPGTTYIVSEYGQVLDRTFYEMHDYYIPYHHAGYHKTMWLPMDKDVWVPFAKDYKPYRYQIYLRRSKHVLPRAER